MITFKTEANNAVRAIHVPTGINVFYGGSFNYQTNKTKALLMLNTLLDNKKFISPITTTNFQDKINEFVATLSNKVSEYNQSEQELAQDYLEAFFKAYFEVDVDKEARRAQYLELAKEFGEPSEQAFEKPFMGYRK